jgi:hypothetical protein
MHWRNQQEWALWNDRQFDDQLYTFTHLRPFDMPVLKEARGELPELRVVVRVVFDCHVVTEKADFVHGDARYWLDTGGKGRKFNLSRYQHSLNLPTLISKLPTGKVKCYIGKHIGKYNNFMVWETANGQGHYQAYFDIYKPTTQPPGEVPVLLLYVQSAYLKDEPFAKQRERHKSFGQICAELVGVIAPKGDAARRAKKLKKHD